MRAERAPRAALALEAIAALCLGGALLAAIAGPLRFDLGVATVSVRTLLRPLLIALAVLAVRWWMVPRPRRRHAAPLAGELMLATITAAAVLGWLMFLSTHVGGADSYGYVSAAARLHGGHLTEPEPLARVLPLARPIEALTPLGYVPSPRHADATVPAYPLGLPALMAAAMAVGGSRGPFAIAPLMGLLLLWAAARLSTAWFDDRLVTRSAVALTAIHPLVFTYAIQPMSDVPAAAWYLAAIAALWHRPSRPWIAGAAAAAALLTRPALAPAAAALVLIPVAIDAPRDPRRAARVLVPLVIGIGMLAAVQWRLYGHPLASGYGGVDTLFSPARVATNAYSYGYWIVAALGLPWLGAAAIGVAISPRAVRRTLALISSAVLFPYLAYRTYDHWETLRFLLPALVLLTIAAAAGIVHLARRSSRRAAPVIAATLVAAFAASWTMWMGAQQVFTMPAHEARHALAGELVAGATPAGAVVLALQHSGSLRYYAPRQTVNWDRLPAGRLDDTIAALRANGHRVYLLLDSDTERALFEAKHGPIGSWLPNGQRRSMQLYEAP